MQPFRCTKWAALEDHLDRGLQHKVVGVDPCQGYLHPRSGLSPIDRVAASVFHAGRIDHEIIKRVLPLNHPALRINFHERYAGAVDAVMHHALHLAGLR